MSAYSLQTMLQPVQQLAEMRVHLRQWQQVLQQMQAVRLSAMTSIRTPLLDAQQALDNLHLELDRLEHQFLCILQMQLHHHLTLHGTLPDIDLEPTHPCGARWMCGLRASTPTDKRVCASVDSLKCISVLSSLES